MLSPEKGRGTGRGRGGAPPAAVVAAAAVGVCGGSSSSSSGGRPPQTTDFKCSARAPRLRVPVLGALERPLRAKVPGPGGSPGRSAEGSRREAGGKARLGRPAEALNIQGRAVPRHATPRHAAGLLQRIFQAACRAVRETPAEIRKPFSAAVARMQKRPDLRQVRRGAPLSVAAGLPARARRLPADCPPTGVGVEGGGDAGGRRE